MLTKQFRFNLREETDFFDKCKKVHSPYFSFFYKPSENFQVTIIVSKKVLKLATKRNSTKRIYRQAIQSNLDNLIKFKIKLVIVVHTQGTMLSVSEIAQQIEKNVQKIRI